MRLFVVLLLLLPVLPAGANVLTAVVGPSAQPVRGKAITITQRQFARQFGQRLARSLNYRDIDADWRQFVKTQPRGTDFKALVELVRREAIHAKNQEIRLKRKRLNQASQRKMALGHELAHVRQQRLTPALQARTAELERRYRQTKDDELLQNIELQGLLQKQQQLLQQLSQISKMMHDVAMAVIRKIG